VAWPNEASQRCQLNGVRFAGVCPCQSTNMPCIASISAPVPITSCKMIAQVNYKGQHSGIAAADKAACQFLCSLCTVPSTAGGINRPLHSIRQPLRPRRPEANSLQATPRKHHISTLWCTMALLIMVAATSTPRALHQSLLLMPCPHLALVRCCLAP
jgi:hypothetical protein